MLPSFLLSVKYQDCELIGSYKDALAMSRHDGRRRAAYHQMYYQLNPHTDDISHRKLWPHREPIAIATRLY